MPQDPPDAVQSGETADEAVSVEFREFDDVRLGLPDETEADDGRAQTDRELFLQDLVEIERATAALRKGEPALESWSELPAATVHKPRPVWLLVGLLWVSTALVTAGAVAAIAALVG
jgi:hypothetical protein